MRRLFRWAFNVAAAVSAVLFVATCVLWVRSYSRPKSGSLSYKYDDYWIENLNGRVVLHIGLHNHEPANNSAQWDSRDELVHSFDWAASCGDAVRYLDSNGSYAHFAGFGFEHYKMLHTDDDGVFFEAISTYWDIVVPHWFLTTGLFGFPLVLGLSVYQRRRRV